MDKIENDLNYAIIKIMKGWLYDGIVANLIE